METIRLPSAFGAEVRGLDPAHIKARDAEALREALWTHRLLVFRNASLSPAQHVELMSSFGRIIVEVGDEAALSSPDKLYGKVAYVTTRPSEYISGRDAICFHSDFQFYADGAGAVLSLHAVEVEQEHPTVFANMIEATKHMPESLLARLRPLDLVQCCNFFHPTPADTGGRSRFGHRDAAKDYGNTAALHPAVGRHRVTGEEMVNICQAFSSHFLGLSYAESDQLFAETEPYQYAEPFLHRHHWRTGDLVIWDNIALQHGRAPLDGTFTRHLQRVVSDPWDIAERSRRTALAMAGRSLA
jgi:taurine dioxygenase